jgi:hypothetical protein
MKVYETMSKNAPEGRRNDKGYTISSTGNVVVDVDRLLKNPRVREIAQRARDIVQKHDRRSTIG